MEAMVFWLSRMSVVWVGDHRPEIILGVVPAVGVGEHLQGGLGVLAGEVGRQERAGGRGVTAELDVLHLVVGKELLGVAVHRRVVGLEVGELGEEVLKDGGRVRLLKGLQVGGARVVLDGAVPRFVAVGTAAPAGIDRAVARSLLDEREGRLAEGREGAVWVFTESCWSSADESHLGLHQGGQSGRFEVARSGPSRRPAWRSVGPWRRCRRGR